MTTLMARIWQAISAPSARAALGARVEAGASIAFGVVRWGIVLGFVRFLAAETGSPGFRALYWGLSAVLFAYLASLFLLRPEIPVFRRPDTGAKRMVQTLLNLGVCALAFAAVMWVVNGLADAAVAHRFLPAAAS